MTDQHSEQRQTNSRRKFLKYSGAAIGGAVITGVIAGCTTKGNNTATPPPAETKPVQNFNEATMFFNQEQLQITEAAAERIFPKDDLGPGAAELGVAFYIDHQLAGQFGNNVREYRMGPFGPSEATQGDYQSIPRHAVFTMGLQAIQDESQKKHQKGFAELTDEEKDTILTSLQKGEIQVVTGVTGQSFFNLLRSMTIEGAYCDPVYGGNKNMMGWKMRQYPGNQMSYTDIMEKDEFIVMEPRSLHDHFAH
ncbi:gluconate 2-dehydrogenase subunit 3 family protein [Paenibacillus ginsengarvi]|uniref:Gluconate 2-dehydrogenase subunit 3 family protein n=1 Tax=Paenibacillus ginsengarvi TaxID=400777 RepID=A0A3B0BCR1_9BACL|nr:gluconate 2-dehydrogenase subunit 3 family protein [Paenibacillus ginsengarvi]RKN70128.1 gluconate 2-dehydrogenase subunit 3 family protein [Paenibacillus ginsengarvi]